VGGGERSLLLNEQNRTRLPKLERVCVYLFNTSHSTTACTHHLLDRACHAVTGDYFVTLVWRPHNCSSLPWSTSYIVGDIDAIWPSRDIGIKIYTCEYIYTQYDIIYIYIYMYVCMTNLRCRVPVWLCLVGYLLYSYCNIPSLFPRYTC